MDSRQIHVEGLRLYLLWALEHGRAELAGRITDELYALGAYPDDLLKNKEAGRAAATA